MMSRLLVVAAAILLSIAIGGCGGYRTVSKPWNVAPTDRELGGSEVLRPGDRLLVVTNGAQVSEGFLVEMDEFALVLADTQSEARLVTFPIDSIASLGIDRSGPAHTLQTMGIVALTTAFLYMIIDEESEG